MHANLNYTNILNPIKQSVNSLTTLMNAQLVSIKHNPKELEPRRGHNYIEIDCELNKQNSLTLQEELQRRYEVLNQH